MAHKAQYSNDGSWILERDSDTDHSVLSDDVDEVDLSFESDVDQVAPKTPPNRLGKPIPSSTVSRSSPPTSAGLPVDTPVPSFVMPSIHLDSNSPITSPYPRKRTIHASSNKSTPTHSGFGSRSSVRTIRRSQSQGSEGVRDYMEVLWQEMFMPLVRFAHTVCSHVFGILRPALAFFAALWIIFYLGHYLLTSTLARSLAPICSIPGMSHLDLPFCSARTPPPPPVEFDQLMAAQSAFEDVLSSSSIGITLPTDMKRSESSIRDLKHVVQFSSLPSRNELVFEFTGFIDTAKEASGELTKFNSRLGRAVDHVISTNRWTLQAINSAAERKDSQGAVGRFISDTVLYPFMSSKMTETILLGQYLKHTRAIEEQVAQLILEAQSLLAILQNLDDRLDVIHGITTRDGVSVKGSRDDVLAQLWTKLGGNRSTKKKFEEQLHLLQQVGNFRKVAWEHVSATMLKLQSMAAGLEDLRERVAAPDVLSSREEIPLTLHIDNIQMAVERLDSQRMEVRRLESEHHRKVLGKGEPQLALPGI